VCVREEQGWRHLYQLLVENRDVVREALRVRGIGAQVHYRPIYAHPYYQRLGFPASGYAEKAEWHAAHTLSIPLYPTMTDEQVGYVIEHVMEVV